MSKRILYNFPSHSRHDKFLLCLNNIHELSHDQNYTIVAKVDDDDPCKDQYVKYAIEFGNMTKVDIVMYGGTSTSKIHAVNRDIPAYGWDILVTMSDDMIWLIPGFDNIIREHCGPDDFVHFPDGYVNRRLCTLPIMGRDYYLRDGYVGHPDYKSLWADNEWQEVAKKRGRYKFVNMPIVRHDHPAWTGAPKDALLQHTESFYHEDQATYQRRRRAGFPK